MSRAIKVKNKKHTDLIQPEIDNNPGLDADGSSSDTDLYPNLNNDNDRISGNPDGEDDQNNTHEPPGHSSLADK